MGTNTPCVLERAFEDAGFLRTFRDDDHLVRLCGDREVLIRRSCHPDAEGRHVFIEGVGSAMGKFAGYVETLRTSEGAPREYTGKSRAARVVSPARVDGP